MEGGVEGVTLAGPNALDTVGDIVHLYSVVSSPSPESVAALIVGIITSIQLNVTLSLYNGGILPVYIPAETNQVFVDGLLIGTSSTGSAWVWPGSSVTVHLAETIPTGQLLPIVSSAIESGGNVEYNIVGSASLAGVSAPFSKSGQLDIGAYLVKQLGIPIPGLT